MSLILSILLVISSVWAQYTPPKPELFAKVERVFQELEPGWKLEGINRGPSSDPVTQSIVYRSRKGQAAISLSIWKREQDAYESFAGVAIAFDNQHGKSMRKSTLPELGDQNYMWANKSSTWPTIKFRKGTTIVSVFAPNVVIAERFARNIAAQIDE